ncbi:SDR family NAD(P)-dependent oxidoreductase [Microcella sp.]|uniref:SDR family NAD(P)-dependent oxidoreductase n=1 Tax=Microcella sp. TaxID=1913979 RepID=UPI00299F6B71|nr:SDR family NAD(P)-dependent oxidoreductase [Microcella sp.]MDX2026685.1 SDR family NAD(P)-dependent oxidoreductase [Microcella sp.]
MPTALITGATAGIGAEFARQLAARATDLVIVARDADRLAATALALHDEFGVHVEAIPADLLTAEGLAAVDRRLAADERPIDLLVNTAGYGIRGELDENSFDVEKRHLDIHVTVPLQLTQTALRGMVARGHGRIVLIASVAAFTPRGTYSAAKAWAVMFARGANLVYRRRGVCVTAVCPGFVRTEFHDRMKVSTEGIPEFLWLRAPNLVRLALRGIDRGRSVVIPTLRYRVIAGLARVLPDRVGTAGQFRSRD